MFCDTAPNAKQNQFPKGGGLLQQVYLTTSNRNRYREQHYHQGAFSFYFIYWTRNKRCRSFHDDEQRQQSHSPSLVFRLWLYSCPELSSSSQNKSPELNSHPHVSQQMTNILLRVRCHCLQNCINPIRAWGHQRAGSLTSPQRSSNVTLKFAIHLYDEFRSYAGTCLRWYRLTKPRGEYFYTLRD